MNDGLKRIEEWNLLNALHINGGKTKIATGEFSGDSNLKFEDVNHNSSLEVMYFGDLPFDQVNNELVDQFQEKLVKDGLMIFNVTGKDIDESISDMFGSRGVKLYLLEHPETKYLIYIDNRKGKGFFKTIDWNGFKSEILKLS